MKTHKTKETSLKVISLDCPKLLAQTRSK